MANIFPIDVLYALLDIRYARTFTGSPSDTVVKVTAPAPDTAVNIPAANDPSANIMVIIKDKDDTSGYANRITPASGTIAGLPYLDITMALEAIRIFPSATDNNWYKI
jgi:hypothetical protein